MENIVILFLILILLCCLKNLYSVLVLYIYNWKFVYISVKVIRKFERGGVLVFWFDDISGLYSMCGIDIIIVVYVILYDVFSCLIVVKN